MADKKPTPETKDAQEHPEDALRRVIQEQQLELARAHVARWGAEAKYVQLAYNLAAGELQKLEAEAQEGPVNVAS